MEAPPPPPNAEADRSPLSALGPSDVDAPVRVTRACSNCRRAKTKCVARSRNGPCIRCCLSHFECVYEPTQRQRQRQWQYRFGTSGPGSVLVQNYTHHGRRRLPVPTQPSPSHIGPAAVAGSTTPLRPSSPARHRRGYHQDPLSSRSTSAEPRSPGRVPRTLTPYRHGTRPLSRGSSSFSAGSSTESLELSFSNSSSMESLEMSAPAWSARQSLYEPLSTTDPRSQGFPWLRSESPQFVNASLAAEATPFRQLHEPAFAIYGGQPQPYSQLPRPRANEHPHWFPVQQMPVGVDYDLLSQLNMLQQELAWGSEPYSGGEYNEGTYPPNWQMGSGGPEDAYALGASNWLAMNADQYYDHPNYMSASRP